MKDKQAEKIVQIFKDAGMNIEIGAAYSVRGQIAQLINGCKNMTPSIDLLQKRLEDGCSLARQDGEWWLFDAAGNGISGGKTLRDVLIDLIWTDS